MGGHHFALILLTTGTYKDVFMKFRLKAEYNHPVVLGTISNKQVKQFCKFITVQFSSVTQSCLTVCNSMDCSMPGFTVHHQFPERTQTHGHLVSDAIQPSHPLSPPSPPAISLSQHQGLLQWVNSLHQVAKVLEFQLQHQSLQWTFRTDFL